MLTDLLILCTQLVLWHLMFLPQLVKLSCDHGFYTYILCCQCFQMYSFQKSDPCLPVTFSPSFSFVFRVLRHVICGKINIHYQQYFACFRTQLCMIKQRDFHTMPKSLCFHFSQPMGSSWVHFSSFYLWSPWLMGFSMNWETAWEERVLGMLLWFPPTFAGIVTVRFSCTVV